MGGTGEVLWGHTEMPSGGLCFAGGGGDGVNDIDRQNANPKGEKEGMSIRIQKRALLGCLRRQGRKTVEEGSLHPNGLAGSRVWKEGGGRQS